MKKLEKPVDFVLIFDWISFINKHHIRKVDSRIRQMITRRRRLGHGGP
jgi:hypothetical protein